MDQSSPTRRRFLVASGNLASAGWIALNWPQIAAAAEHAGHSAHADKSAIPNSFTTLTPAEAADIDAISNQIVPGGATPGARDAHAAYFIDNALGSFFGTQLPAFRQGLVDFQKSYSTHKDAAASFAKATDAQQIAYLHEVDKTPFFISVRRLTVLGILALPKYGGNTDNKGWNLIKVVDNHAWAPPFGFYDIDYPGFEPFPGTKPYTA